VKLWITLNEPWIISVLGYGDGVFAPGITGIGDNVYTVTHNLIRAHAKAYRVYANEFVASQNGKFFVFVFAFGLSATLTPKALNLLFPPPSIAPRRYFNFFGACLTNINPYDL
jgi:hypothetical protein